LQDCAKHSTNYVTKIPKFKSRRCKKKKTWFTESCTGLRNTVKQYEKLVNQYPFNGQYCGSLVVVLSLSTQGGLEFEPR
jgi:hypothetical protein